MFKVMTVLFHTVIIILFDTLSHIPENFRSNSTAPVNDYLTQNLPTTLVVFYKVSGGILKYKDYCRENCRSF